MPGSEPVVSDFSQVQIDQRPEDRLGLGTLNGQLGVSMAGVGNPGPKSVLPANVAIIPAGVAGIDTKEKPVFFQPMDQNVVHERPLLGEQGGVLNLTGSEASGIIAGGLLHQSQAAGPIDLDLSHVADVEQTHPSPHSQVLPNDTGVFDGHFPAAKSAHPGPQTSMQRVQGSLLQGRRHRLPVSEGGIRRRKVTHHPGGVKPIAGPLRRRSERARERAESGPPQPVPAFSPEGFQVCYNHRNFQLGKECRAWSPTSGTGTREGTHGKPNDC